MSKLAMEVLSSDKPTVADLRKKIAETENSLWYSNNQNLSKYAGGTGIDGATGGQLKTSELIICVSDLTLYSTQWLLNLKIILTFL